MSFGQARVLAFESRRAKEMGELIRINGGEPFLAPALMEVPLEHNSEAFTFADCLYAGDFDMMIFLTGVGARFLQRVLATRDPESRFLDALRRMTVVARGPKPVAVLREWQVPVHVVVPEPNTSRELLKAIADRPDKRVAVQEYGRTNNDLMTGLTEQGRVATRIPVYEWTLPTDTAPLSDALAGLLAGQFSAALFTTGVQVEHFLLFAARQGQSAAAVKALQGVFIGSIGPTCSESLRASGLEPAMEPSHPKMGILVREAAIKYGEKA
jgi:uroporphyrinogen-III synthase